MLQLTEEEVAVLIDYHEQQALHAAEENEVEEVKMRKKRIAELFLVKSI